MTLRSIVPLSMALTVLTIGSAVAHHSFAGEFDGSVALRMEGVVTRVEVANPHSHIYIDVRSKDGAVERWALEGPGAFVLKRRGWDRDLPWVGERLGVCGYAARHDAPSNKTSPPHGGARRLSAAVLTMRDGEKRLWENYRQGKCELDVETVFPTTARP